MAIKPLQVLRALPPLIRDPYDIPAILDVFDGTADLPPIRRAYERMVAGLSEEEQQRLEELTDRVHDLEALDRMEPGTFGRAYADFMSSHGYDQEYYLNLSPGSVEAFQKHWTMRRFARTHDFHHTMLGLSGSLADEIGLQVFNLINFGEPWGAATIALLPYMVARWGDTRRIVDRLRRCVSAGRKMESLFLFPWEEHLETSIVELRARFGVPPEGLIPLEDQGKGVYQQPSAASKKA